MRIIIDTITKTISLDYSNCNDCDINHVFDVIDGIAVRHDYVIMDMPSNDKEEES
jgi:hypothetical protein